ncbi:MAG: SMC family ATPase, partial [Thermoplasmata archaeon]|nr:SMC family ATPase [Thermoplasmata archaeon]
MQLRRIRVRNIRSYVSADLPLGPGTTLLSGDVGSGKTSILYAIEMALFGFAEVDPTYLVRHQAGESEVVLSLADDGHSYEFGRRFRRRRRKGRDIFELESASFSVDGATTNYSVTEIRLRAISLLGFPDNPNPRAHSDLWRWAVYVPQERMREILGQEPDERLETVRKALGLEQYRTAADNAQLLAAELRRMAERADAEARGRDHLLEEQPTLLREVEEREAQARTATIEVERGAGDLRASEALLAELELRRQSFERDRGEEDQLVDRARSDAEQLRRLDAHAQEIGDESVQWRKRVADAAGLTQRRDRCAAELHAKDERLSVLRSEREARSRELAELAAAESKGDSAQEALEHARTETARAGREAELATAELARLTTEGPQKEPPAPTPRALPEIDGAIEASRAGLERSLASISRLEQISSENEELRRAGICPRCHQKVDVSEFAVHFQEVSTDLARERSLLSELRASVERLGEERKARERFDRSHQRWTDLEASRVNARERAARSTAQQEASAARLVELEAASRAAGNAVERLRGRADSARALLDELVRSERERVEIERQLSELAAELDGLGSAEAALERLASDERRLAQERTAMVAQAEDRRRQLATVRARLAEMPRLDAELSLARERREAARRSTALSERALERAHTLVESARSRLTDIGRLL